VASGKLFVISGPSGVGKGTLVAQVVSRLEDKVWLSISATTRSPREGEVDGQHYFFLTVEDFEEGIENEAFLEWAQVHTDTYYGTPIQSVREHMDAGQHVILEIDVQGALQVKEIIPEAVLVFIEPPSMEILESRLSGRGTESADEINVRLNTAKVELEQKTLYDYCLVNDDLDEATDELLALIEKA